MTEPETITTPGQEAEVVACAKQEDTAAEVQAVADVHALSKEELLARLRDIVKSRSVNSHREVMAIKQALFSLRQREINEEMNAYVEAGNSPETFSANPDEAENEAKDLMAEFRVMRQQYLEAEEKRMEQNLEAKKEILARMQAISENADSVNMHFQEFQDLQQKFRDIKDVPPSAETDIWKKFQLTVEQYYDTLKMNKELRDLDFRKNLEAKRRIIAEANALAEEPDVVEAGRRLQLLHTEWREIGPVSKELREEIWEEFRQASAKVNRRHQDYFEKRKAEEKANEEAKEAIICELKAIDRTALKTFAAWDEAREKVKALQEKWKTIGFASRKVNNDLYARFRSECDAFFNARTEHFQSTREAFQANLEKKTRLCERAEAILAEGDSKKNLEEMQKLQAEWRTIGNVGRKYSDAIWERFSSTCNKFFALRKEQNAVRHTEEMANLKAKRAIIEEINGIPADADRSERLRSIRELQARYEAIGFVPFKHKDQLQADYRKACDAVYGAINSARDRERRSRFEGQLDSMRDDARRLGSEQERIKRQIDAKRQELKTYANNLGFFNIKTSAGNTMVKEMERKMAHIEDEIKQLSEKLALVEAAKAAK